MRREPFVGSNRMAILPILHDTQNVFCAAYYSIGTNKELNKEHQLKHDHYKYYNRHAPISTNNRINL
jgi:hypothetical protein